MVLTDRIRLMFFLKKQKNNITKTTCNSGYLGSQVDEERSELR